MVKLILFFFIWLLAGCGGNHYAPVRDATVQTTPVTRSLSTVVAETAVLDTTTTWVPALPSSDVHVVQPGETLYSIAAKYQRKVQELITINHLQEPYMLQLGQTLRLQTQQVVPATETLTTSPSLATLSEISPVNQPQTISTVSTEKTTAPFTASPTAPEATTQEIAKPTEQPVASASLISPAAGKSKWIWPASGKVLRGYSKKNKGLDIQGNKGEPVYATASGQVVYSGTGLRGYGQLVIIKHSADFLSAYAHNNKVLVTEGQHVTQGQQIAEIGSTGTNTTKLHFELRFKGKPVDPIKYLPPR